MQIASLTDKGLVRETNQDSFAAGELSGEVAWLVVCDGMGGANGGNIASAMTVKSISESISSGYREGMNSNSIRDLLISAASVANVSVYDMSKSVEALHGMGTTVVAAIIASGVAHIIHAGDSRAYIFDEGRLSQVTRDHSVVQMMRESGKLTPEEAKEYPRRNVITRALGVDRATEVEYNEVELSGSGMVFVCTDGLVNFVDDSEIEKTLKENKVDDCPRILIDLANKNGGADNITVVIAAQ